MLPGIMSSPAGVLDASSTVREVVHALGLTSGLKLLLDAGDSASYTSGQKWLDLSGNGYDFFRGSSSSTESPGDPTFNGVVGGRSSSEFWSGNPAWFDYDTANETWMHSLHKNSAVFSVAGWFNKDADGSWNVFSSSVNQADGSLLVPAVVVAGKTATNHVVVVHQFNGSADPNVPSATADSGLAPNYGGWTFFGIAVDEASSAARFQVNGSQATKSFTYVSPSSSNSSGRFEIGVTSQDLNCLCIWEGAALSLAQLDSFYQATRRKFGL